MYAESKRVLREQFNMKVFLELWHTVLLQSS